MEKSHQNQKTRLPAEWETQESIWMTWPQNLDTWEELLPEIENKYLELFSIILNHQNLYVICNSLSEHPKLKEFNQSDYSYKIQIHELETNDCWIRDYGGLSVLDNTGNKKVLNWKFNSWGGKYPPWEKDNNIPIHMAKLLELESINIPVVLEGGSIDVNGQGTLLTTNQCLLNKNRNPELSQSQIESYLKNHFDVPQIIWIDGGLVGDDTDGHVDQIARFINIDTILCCLESDLSNNNYFMLRSNFDNLLSLADKLSLNIVDLPMPKQIEVNGLIIPASYANFLIINGAVLVPVFNDPADAKVVSIFETYFPDRVIYPIQSSRLAFGQGGLHCISMQVPA